MEEKLLKGLERVSDEIIAHKKHLTELDAAIGDGDHGINMARGFKKVKEKLATQEASKRSEILKMVALTLISNVGGASGPLYGTAFLRASQVIDDQQFGFQNLIEVAEATVKGVQERGKAEEGDKTMLDTMIPTLESLKKDFEEGIDLNDALQTCVEAAEKGMKETIPLKARKGRASYLGERSKGHQDPGATSSYIIIKNLVEVFTW